MVVSACSWKGAYPHKTLFPNHCPKHCISSGTNDRYVCLSYALSHSFFSPLPSPPLPTNYDVVISAPCFVSRGPPFLVPLCLTRYGGTGLLRGPKTRIRIERQLNTGHTVLSPCFHARFRILRVCAVCVYKYVYTHCALLLRASKTKCKKKVWSSVSGRRSGGAAETLRGRAAEM